MKYHITHNADGVSIKAVNIFSKSNIIDTYQEGRETPYDYQERMDQYDQFDINNPALPVHPDSVHLLKGLTEWVGGVEEVVQNRIKQEYSTCDSDREWKDCRPGVYYRYEYETRKVAKLISPKANKICGRNCECKVDDDCYYQHLSTCKGLLIPTQSITKENEQGEIKSLKKEINELLLKSVTTKAYIEDLNLWYEGAKQENEMLRDALNTLQLQIDTLSKENENLKAPAIDTGEKKEYEVSKESFSSVYPASFFICPSCDRDTIEGACYCSNCGDKLVWNF